MRRFRMILTIALAAITIAGFPEKAQAVGDFVVYSVYKGLDLGNSGDIPQKDYYVNMGTTNGVRAGTVLEVARRFPTYDLLSEKLYKDVTFPIARLKVIHVENNAAIARLDSLLSPEKTPSITPRAVMVGDLVRIAQ